MTEFERTTVRQTVDEPAVPAADPTRRPAGTVQSAYVPVRPALDDATPMSARTVVREHSTTYLSGWAMAVRAVGLVFGILQSLIVLRVILLALGAQQSNDIVAAILGVTNVFVEPFRGMFRIDHLAGSGSVLDIAAIVALIGWTLIEALIVSILRLADRRTAWQS